MEESLADMVLGFFEEWNAEDSSGSEDLMSDGGGGSGEEAGGADEARTFWESQDQNLKDTLMRSGSTERKILAEVEEAIRKMREEGAVCDCSGGVGGECGKRWGLRGIADRLREKGYDSAVCRSKWQRSPDFPSGEHSYIDVMIGSRKVVIEPSFRGEFEVARANTKYNILVARLPEVFVGKAERLRSVVKIMCRGAKRCMKENRMHMGPWRKHEYMLSKWFGNCERLSVPLPSFPARDAVLSAERQLSRPRASMLTFDLHRPVVKVG
ncbi:hypothetical protein HPP92_024059 [Vanilla planifolia]|uniref:Uncharacterized protein n=1 Tax=Vanilla planifolia TaxID=51239 RepID=A0A835PQ12_VANPL|nr:hypothetical protein HPP92_024059 [Vanilla planifolia]